MSEYMNDGLDDIIDDEFGDLDDDEQSDYDECGVIPIAFGTTADEKGTIRTLFKCPECYVETERYQRFCWNCGRGLNWDG